jgi:hypothetical protein
MVTAIFVGLFALIGLVVFPRTWLHATIVTREAMASEIDYRAPTSEDAKLVKALDGQRAKQAALVALGFRHVGDLVLVVRSTGRVHGAVRILLDELDKTCALLVASYGYGMIQFESHTDTQELVTSHSRSDNYIEAGPTSQRQFVNAKESVAAAYRSHVEFAKSATVTFATLEELMKVMQVAHDRLLAWRATQSPDSLLDRDLRKILGGHHRFYGWWIARRIQTVPRASIHR